MGWNDHIGDDSAKKQDTCSICGVRGTVAMGTFHGDYGNSNYTKWVSSSSYYCRKHIKEGEKQVKAWKGPSEGGHATFWNLIDRTWTPQKKEAISGY
jgi:hypothetical protein